MKIAVLGAGAVGCYYGGMLARAGHEVVLIGRPAHVEAMSHEGLLLETKTFTARVPVLASTDPARVRGAAMVLFCVKSTDTESAGAMMAPCLDAGIPVLSLQNGVDNALRLQAVLQSDVLPVLVYVAAEMAAAGHVRHHGRGELVIGQSSQAKMLSGLFSAAAVPVRISDNIVGELWAKLIINCALNALSAITLLPYGQLIQGQGVMEVLRDVVAECHAVAAAEGVVVPGDSRGAVHHIIGSMPTQFSSMAQDMKRGKSSEIDHLNGYVVRRGEALGIPVPTNRVLHALVKLLETQF